MYSLDLNRMVSFPRFGGGTNLSPAWSGDGLKLAFSSSRSGEPEIFVADASGANARRLTDSTGAGCFSDMEPQDERAARLCERANRSAADLYDGDPTAPTSSA